MDQTVLRNLANAQMGVDAAQRKLDNDGIAAICMTPGDVRSDELNEWRAGQMAPARQALETATDERDNCLQAAGMSLDDWLARWEQAKTQAKAELNV